ncbi:MULTISPECIES: SMP-30/gluconolactonase/LRE family protein [unclassified Acidovorax]|uniref:SMP-30/gluconolactonase/LRE family protein n=1 Tax=unclassified Acidovorax TaxID=2684926 RepID=UPI001C463F83|nr:MULTISPECIES: SMP-30/gluconolactonase/LRE family protein [unclassified Acidovorax]MBV7429392.1 SMP-30/gluconolactonase/LRE family protein [Acidovorax sp. sif0732]MBV7451218.1 SMP-30/gluconolactonase/LRE family protein [Acidovorax sp. sif0715]
MYLVNPPAVRQLEVFTTMPEDLRRRARSAWSDANRGGAITDSFLEGPVLDKAGNLYVTDVPWGRIFRVDPNGCWHTVVEYDGEPNGMKFLDDSILVITDYKKGLIKLDVRSGVFTPLLARRNSESFKGVNDLVFDRHGNIYFTDQGQSGMHDPTGRLFRLCTDGRLDLLISNIPSPNGVALSPDEKVVYVAVTRGNCVWRAPLQADGSVSKVNQFFTSYGPSGPDGLAVDAEGRLFVANPGLGYVWVLNRHAEPEHVLCGPKGASITNMAFGGADRKTLYVTNSTDGQIMRTEVSTSGVMVSAR